MQPASSSMNNVWQALLKKTEHFDVTTSFQTVPIALNNSCSVELREPSWKKALVEFRHKSIADSFVLLKLQIILMSFRDLMLFLGFCL